MTIMTTTAWIDNPITAAENIGILLLDEQLLILALNDSAATQLGQVAAEMHGRRVTEFLLELIGSEQEMRSILMGRRGELLIEEITDNSQDRPRFRNTRVMAKHHQSESAGLYVVITDASQAIQDKEVVYRALSDEQSLNEMLTDVNHQMDAEIQKRERIGEELRLQTDLLLSIVYNLNEGVAVTDATGTLLLHNAEAKRLMALGAPLGTSPDGGQAQMYFSDETTPFPAADLPLARALAGEVVDEAEIYVRCRQAPRGVHLEVTARPLSGGGVGRRVVVVARDITTRKRFEEQGRQVEKERLSALEAMASSRAKSVFLAQMSHEIRNPLNAVMGMANLLQGTSLAPDQSRLVGYLADASEQLYELVTQMLDLSRIDAGAVEVVERPLDVRKAVEASLNLYRAQGEAKGLDMELRIASDIPSQLLGDPLLLRQILMNLIGNALKFTNRGGITVTVRLLKSKDSRHIPLCFEVHDSGIGIATEGHQMIFEPFEQGDPTSLQDSGGSGLGLTICSRLVEMMGGTIQVSSEVGQGSTFTFTLDLKPIDAIEEVLSSPVKEAEPQPADLDPGIPHRALIAEDSVMNRHLLEIYLKTAGYAVDSAENGKVALELFKTHSYDVMLMDLQMPEMDGFEATAAIRAFERAQGRSETPIIAISAYDMPQHLKRCKDVGCTDHLSKPFQRQVLINMIHRHTEKVEDGLVIVPP